MRVIYKKLEDEVIALFPEMAGDNNPYTTCLSYQHIGQHSAASVSLSQLRPARANEFAKLHKELTNHVGYELTIAHKFTQKDLSKRKLQTAY